MLEEGNHNSDQIRETLIEFGVSPAIAHEASIRYNNVETAANWAFGDGANWTPPQNVPKDPFNSGVMGRAPSPVRRHSSQEPVPQFASNNPFNPINSAFPPPPLGPPGMAQEDADLERALALSTEDDRAQRERSVRASAPPPSPGRIDDEPIFGPSNKDDPQGSLAMVRTNTETNNDKEEMDLQRALQESMMTASFHSAPCDSGDDLPPPTERAPDAPLVYVTRSELSWAAPLVQGLAAVPQLSRLASLGDRPSDPETFRALRSLFAMQNPNTYPNSYQRIDREIETLNNATGVTTALVSLPPAKGVLIDRWMAHLPEILKGVIEDRVALVQSDPDHELKNTLSSLKFGDVLRCPDQLLTTLLQTRPTVGQTHVTITRTLSEPTDIHGNLSQIIWGNNNAEESILSMADVVFVLLQRTPGVRADQWTFDEDVVLDRYMSNNMVWATQVRAQEHLLKTDLQRLQEQIDTLSTFRGHSLPDALAALDKELANEPEDDGRDEIKQELQAISANINARLATLKEQSDELQKNIKEGLFATDDEEKNQHRYRLRSILWHDGFTTPGSHLYSYVQFKANWWKIAETEVNKVDFETIQNDKTGAFTDGGPFLLIYSRTGARPVGHSREEQEAANEEHMDIESVLGSTSSTASIPVVQRGTLRRLDLLGDDEGEDEDGAEPLQGTDLEMAGSDVPRRPLLPEMLSPHLSGSPELIMSGTLVQEPQPALQPQPAPQPQPVQQPPPVQQQEVEMAEPELHHPEPHHAATVDDKGDWEIVDKDASDKPAPVHRATR